MVRPSACRQTALATLRSASPEALFALPFPATGPERTGCPGRLCRDLRSAEADADDRGSRGVQRSGDQENGRHASLSRLPVCSVRRHRETGQAKSVRGFHTDAGDCLKMKWQRNGNIRRNLLRKESVRVILYGMPVSSLFGKETAAMGKTQGMRVRRRDLSEKGRERHRRVFVSFPNGEPNKTALLIRISAGIAARPASNESVCTR